MPTRQTSVTCTPSTQACSEQTTGKPPGTSSLTPEGRGLMSKQPDTRDETQLPISRGVGPSEGEGRGSSCVLQPQPTRAAWTD